MARPGHWPRSGPDPRIRCRGTCPRPQISEPTRKKTKMYPEKSSAQTVTHTRTHTLLAVAAGLGRHSPRATSGALWPLCESRRVPPFNANAKSTINRQFFTTTHTFFSIRSPSWVLVWWLAFVGINAKHTTFSSSSETERNSLPSFNFFFFLFFSAAFLLLCVNFYARSPTTTTTATGNVVG